MSSDITLWQTVSTAVLVTMVASYTWLQHLQADPKQVDTPQRSLHDIAEVACNLLNLLHPHALPTSHRLLIYIGCQEQLQTLPKTRVLLVGVFMVIQARLNVVVLYLSSLHVADPFLSCRCGLHGELY